MAKTEKVSSQSLVTELNVSANIMAMEPGLYCIFHVDNAAIDPVTGLPGVRVTPPPGQADPELEIRTFGEGGWLGGAAAMVQTPHQASVLVTVYRDAAAASQGPQLQVVRLGDAPKPLAQRGGAAAARPVPAQPVPQPAPAAAPAQGEPEPSVSREEAEIAAHIQRRGDVLSRVGDWMGVPGSQQWIEGFALAPRGAISVKDVEYQAVLGRGWLSPWSEGGQFCGSRGMALPILGLRVRLKGAFAATHAVRVEASFTDGTRIGPVEEDVPVEAPSLAPLEAFRLRFVPLDEAAMEDLSFGADDEVEDETPVLAAELLQVAPAVPARSSPPRGPGRRPAASRAPAAKKPAVAKPAAVRAKAAKAPASRTQAKPVKAPAAKTAAKTAAKAKVRGRPAAGSALARLASRRAGKGVRGGRS